MKLRDFVKETLSEIAFGIRDAKDETGDVWAISPATLNGESLTEKSYIEFDLAVTANESTDTGKDGRGGLKAEIEVLGNKIGGELGGGVDFKKGSSTQSISRITFKVPVYMNATYTGKIVEK